MELIAKIEARRVVDLSHPIHPHMSVWPGSVPFTRVCLMDYPQGYRYDKFEMGESTGTHVDAPAHFIPGGRCIDQIPATDLVVPAVVIDVQAKTGMNSDYRLTAEDIQDWEARHHPIPAGALVIVNTGWHKRFHDPGRYLNCDAEKVLHFPGIGRSAGEFLVRRDVAGVGIDTLSIDYGPSTDFPAHKVILGAGKYQIENLANLDALPPTGATMVIGLLYVTQGAEAPARVLALLP